VLIKAVGLLCLMAQSGIIPPLGPHSTLPVFTTWFADIGDRQSIAESLSTFSAHVAVLRDILARAGAGSLVLLDEIGSGTDPAEGAALAGAVLRTLTRRRAVTLATSHLGALKRLAAETVGVVNASLQFDAETLTPTYRFLKGVPGRSYGLAIAKRLGVPDDVLGDAERALPETERALDALLAAVEERARALEAKEREVTAAAEAARAEREGIEARAVEVAARAKALDKEGREQARAYLLEARKIVEAALSRARAAVDEATAKEARRLLEKAIEETAGEEAGERAGEKAGEEAGEGRREKGQGWISLEELKRQRRVPAPTSRPSDRPTAAVAATEISLLGLRKDEAEPVLVKALDDAVLADLPYLRIIHGKGTGALRQLVHDLLSQDPRVKRFGFAPREQGGAGVTIAELTA
jgi:DNA mismatch repair protein MutS2